MISLYPPTQTEFNYHGDIINAAYDCHVKRDDTFYVTFKVLIDDTEEYKKLKREMIVRTYTPDGLDAFRIWDIEKHNDYIQVEAMHVIYDMLTYEIDKININNGTMLDALTAFKSQLRPGHPFTFYTAIDKRRTFNTDKEHKGKFPAMEVFMGGKHSIVGTWEAELLLNGYDIRLVEALGHHTQALLYEHKNISSFEDKTSNKTLVTRIHARSEFHHHDTEEEKEAKQKKKEEDAKEKARLKKEKQEREQAYYKSLNKYQKRVYREAQKRQREKEKLEAEKKKEEDKKRKKEEKEEAKKPTIIEVTVDSPLIDEYSMVYEKSYENNEIEDPDELIRWAMAKFTHEKVDLPSRSIKVETNIIDGTPIAYGDTVMLRYLTHDVEEEIRCIAYDYDGINRNYRSIEMGSTVPTVAETLSQTVSDKVEVKEAVERQVASIMAANGSNRVYFGPEQPDRPREGDIRFYYPQDHPEDITTQVFEDGAWVDKINMYTAERIQEAIDEMEARADEITENLDGIDGTKIEDMAKKIQALDDQAKLSVGIIGNDKEQIFSANRIPVEFDTEHGVTITVEDGKISFKHNGSGFTPGQPYTLAGINRFVERPFSPLTVTGSLPMTVTAKPNNVKYPTRGGQGSSVEMPKAYHDTYVVTAITQGKVPRVYQAHVDKPTTVKVSQDDASAHELVEVDGTVNKITHTGRDAYAMCLLPHVETTIRLGDW